MGTGDDSLKYSYKRLISAWLSEIYPNATEPLILKYILLK